MKISLDIDKINFLEKEIEDWIYINYKILGMEGWIGRQVKLPSGRADLIGFRNNIIYVIEIKTGVIISEGLPQVCRYAADVQEIINQLEISEIYSIQKMIICAGGITNHIMFEADALKIDLRTFDITVTASFNTGGRHRWTDYAKQNIQKLYAEIIDDKTFNILVEKLK